MKRVVSVVLLFLFLLPNFPVPKPTTIKSVSTSIFYDFVSNASSASWSSGAGTLPFPGSDSDSRGFALFRTQITLEDNKVYSKVLETHPQWVDTGWIQGIYPQITIPNNSKLNINVGFIKGATNSDGVIFRVYFQQGQTRQTLIEQRAFYDGHLDSVSFDLSSLSHKTGNFILYVNALKGSGQDWAVWATANIEQTTVSLSDLTITDIRRSGSTICYTIKNIGDTSVGSPNQLVTYYTALFIDGTLKAQDQLNAILQPGQSIDRCFNFQYSMSGTEDIIRVCADYQQNVTEKDESNNCKEVTWKQELPDLTVTKIYCAGDNQVTFTIANIGTAHIPAGSDGIIDVYVDGTKSTWLKISTVPTSSTGGSIYYAGGTSTFLISTKITKPCVVKVVVDSGNTIAESNETNNTMEAKVEPCIPKPDLTVSKIYCSADSRLTITLSNIGSAPMPAGSDGLVNVYIDGTKAAWFKLSVVPTFSTGGGIYNAGGTSTYELATHITKTISVKVIVDSENNIDEFDETNNTMEAKVEPYKGKIDFAIDSIFIKGSSICYTLINLSSNSLESGNICCSISVDDKIIGEDCFSTIGAASKIERCYSHEMTNGQHIVKVCADSKNVFLEINEDNNCLEKSLYVENLPDLVVDTIDCKDSSIVVYVNNIGPGKIKSIDGIINNVYFNGELKATFDLGQPFFDVQEKPKGKGWAYIVECQFENSSPSNKIKIVLDVNNKLKEQDENNNTKEINCTCKKTIPAPTVYVRYQLPQGVAGPPTSSHKITFIADAHGSNKVSRIVFFINGNKVYECLSPEEKKGIKLPYWECSYTGGPYEPGTIKFKAEAYNIYGVKGVSEEMTINIECGKIGFTFGEGGRTLKSSITIFGKPDKDSDGLSDCWENQAMEEVNPYIEFDEDETQKDIEKNVVNFVRVTPYNVYKGNSHQGYILFYFVVCWPQDYGRFGFEAHSGDTEPFVMVWRLVDEYTIHFEFLYVEGHGGCNKRKDVWYTVGTSCNESGICDFLENKIAQETLCSALEFKNNRLKLYASQDKHTIYPSCEACESTIIVMPSSEMSFDKDKALNDLGQIIGTIVRTIWESIMWFFDKIWDFFTYTKDDNLGTQVVVVSFTDIWNLFWGTYDPIPPEERVISRVKNVTFEKKGDYKYTLGYSITVSNVRPDLAHVKIMFESLYCDDETNGYDPEGYDMNGNQDEPYLLIDGFSLYPEGAVTWAAGVPRTQNIDSGEWCSMPQFVIYEGNVTPFYFVGFSATLFDDDGRATQEGDRRSMAESIAKKLYELLVANDNSCETCGKNCSTNVLGTLRHLFSINIGEDCGSKDKVYRLKTYNVGEPAHLLINDLTKYGFPGEFVDGHNCVKNGEGHFCGSGECNDDCARSILDWISDVSIQDGNKHFERIYEELTK
ncbi:CARDB domain-containing protein [Caldisericum exile]|uniref:CARDB domain-containing protein n=1 Tax=Caldisericum exile (strain DSM 21853 / NBRC 104410 / AZM16c01) TaxID=511051 RepID=A0A7U6GEA0_CALEA|nr:CARDB domain-containing protein [Caldisericum exile]BAL80789.1 hypothetical protein CSE_06630 [Caldisericum exile AZM16c01]